MIAGWLILAASPLAIALDATPVAAAVSSRTAIKARWFGATVLKRSTSQRVLMLELSTAPDLPASDPSLPLLIDERPQMGKIVLLKQDGAPALGVRVIKIYPESGRFAVRTVQTYGAKKSLEVGAVVTALEKVGEVTSLETASSVIARDNADLRELENMPISETIPDSMQGAPAAARSKARATERKGRTDPPPPPGLNDEGSADPSGLAPGADAANDHTPPSPPGAADSVNADDSQFDTDGLDEEGIEITAKETILLDPHRNGLTLGYGMVSNGSTYWSSAGVRYSVVMVRKFLSRSPTLQDTLSIEGGLYFYKLDSNSVITTIGTARYNLWSSPNFSPFFYGGLLFNYATPGAGGTDASANAATGIGIAGGVGLMIQFAPQWEFRFDLGMDILGAGLMLRF